MPFSPTTEQVAIVAATCDSAASLMINAYAGCGKTSTLELLAKALPNEPALALAFNVRIKKELEARFPPHFQVLTLNGLGHRAWAKAIGKMPKVEEKKLGKLVSSVAKKAGVELNSDDWDSVRRLVSAAMQAGLVPAVFPNKPLLPDNSDSWERLCDSIWAEYTPMMEDLGRQILTESIRLAYQGEISFDDQIFCSTMLGGVFPRFPRTLVDEAQDLNSLNHIQLQRVSAGRLFVCGDKFQAINAFRGADSSSMEKIRALREDWIDLPLTLTFRCPQQTVRLCSNHAPGFSAFHTNAPGKILSWVGAEWDWSKLSSAAGGYSKIAILCRNNAPLLSIAFKLIRSGVGVTMLGRDIGKGLTALSRKILPDDSTSAPNCAKLIQAWFEHECDLALANGKEEKISGITDRAECLQAVLSGSGCDCAGALRAALTDLFERNTGKVVLSTGHRAKGLEWPVVLHLDPFRIPSKYALRAADRGDILQLEQDRNLEYVIRTRTMDTYITANLEEFQG